MNILIVGEFSGFAMHLKNGFKKLGHNVTIVMTPDSFKKFRGDDDDILYGYNLTVCGKPIRGTALLLEPIRALRIRRILYKKYKREKLDLIFVINYRFITNSMFKSGTPLSFLRSQLDEGAKLIMSCCGMDPAFCFSNTEMLKSWGREIEENSYKDDRFSWLLDNAHQIVPTIIDYYNNILNYSNYYKFDTTKIHRCIPLPMTINTKCLIKPLSDKQKIVIFHGIIRPVEKGTQFIKAAMERLQAEMPDKVECVCRGNMPYDEYVRLFANVDILIDQCLCNGWGMNTLIGAVSGKCVFVSYGPENGDNMGIPDIPFVSISPNADSIYNTLKELVTHAERIDYIKRASRKFAEEYCECSLIAKKYIEAVKLS